MTQGRRTRLRTTTRPPRRRDHQPVTLPKPRPGEGLRYTRSPCKGLLRFEHTPNEPSLLGVYDPTPGVGVPPPSGQGPGSGLVSLLTVRQAGEGQRDVLRTGVADDDTHTTLLRGDLNSSQGRGVTGDVSRVTWDSGQETEEQDVKG